ncbi:MAG: CBS domain-containing protein [Candidatus Methanomethylophilaceae archaeon]|nr:CBS domain-containing protein [Candidatus Methanomethylophilaceae archaeon]MDD3378677.1 CBS domain-containing protein [Candidatus Methanomethylophilaceae archaeon]MDY0224113.1 CBS domain-containing protein [Candidatus Methanomethylophilaceae archaeon]
MKFPSASEIRKIRKTLDITQTELAHESGISQSTIAKIERGRIAASYDTVVTLFETLERMHHDGRRDITASDVASKDVVTIQSTAKVHIATELMRTTGFSQLPVLAGDTPVGSVSERGIFDLLRKGKTMEELKDAIVSNIMDESFPVVTENTSITSVTTMMSDCNAVLVAKKGKIIGVITNADMLKLV